MALRTSKGTTCLKASMISVFCILLVSMGLGIPVNSFAQSAYNNVQVFVQTQASGLGPFTLTAYNSSGSLVSSMQSNYPAFSLELPSANYLISVTAENLSSSGYYSSYSTDEYGYQVVDISSSRTMTLSTTPLQDITSSKITVQAKYVNGTVIQNAQLYASVVGLMYWWPFAKQYASSTYNFWNETDANGYATLTVPSVPVMVSAWKSVYINLPTNETRVVENVGGENVNVTVYWQPMYLGLSGSTLVTPPATSGSITLHAEQSPYYWYGGLGPVYGTAGVVNAPGTYASATVSNSPGLTPSSVPSQGQNNPNGIAPFGSSQSPSSGTLPPNQIPTFVPVSEGTPSTNATDLLIGISTIGALVLAALSFVIVLRRKLPSSSV